MPRKRKTSDWQESLLELVSCMHAAWCTNMHSMCLHDTTIWLDVIPTQGLRSDKRTSNSQSPTPLSLQLHVDTIKVSDDRLSTSYNTVRYNVLTVQSIGSVPLRRPHMYISAYTHHATVLSACTSCRHRHSGCFVLEQ